MYKDKIIIILTIGVLILGILLIVQDQEIKAYETSFIFLANQEEIELNNCPMCDSDKITINPVNNSFYIECDNCHMRTSYNESLIGLIKYWNGEI